MLKFTELGSKILLGLFALMAGLAIYLPFMEAFALTPAIAFIHRFSITLQLGGSEKTLQPIVFVIPILFIKGALEYNKRYGLITLLKSKLMWAVAALILIDLFSVATSNALGTSVVAFGIHIMNFMIFLTTSMWLKMILDMISKPQLQKVGIVIAKTFAIALGAFIVLNSVVSISQFVDCSFGDGSCHVWKSIDSFFPNRLLEVGHQMFSEVPPIIVRTPGFFGDVNFNGMFSLLMLLIIGTLLVVSELLKTKKGYAPIVEQRYLLVVFFASIVSFILTFSRSAILGFIAVGAAIVFAVVVTLVRRISLPKAFLVNIAKFAALSVVAVIAIFLVGFAIPISTDSGKTSVSGKILSYVVTGLSAKDSSTNGHWILFTDALKLGKLRPAIGHGIGTYTKMFQKYINPNDPNSNPHSTYGTLFADQGIVGLTVYILVIGYFWYLAIKTTKKLTEQIADTYNKEKKLTREFYLTSVLKLGLVLISFGVPFFSIATVSYYGFFLPMTWWWGIVES